MAMSGKSSGIIIQSGNLREISRDIQSVEAGLIKDYLYLG